MCLFASNFYTSVWLRLPRDFLPPEPLGSWLGGVLPILALQLQEGTADDAIHLQHKKTPCVTKQEKGMLILSFHITCKQWMPTYNSYTCVIHQIEDLQD